MERVYCVDVESLFWHFSRLCDGGLAWLEASDRTLSFRDFEFYMVDHPNGYLTVDFLRDVYLDSGILLDLDSLLRRLNAIQALLDDWDEERWICLPGEFCEASISSYAVAVSAVVLLSLIYKYLTGYVDVGSSKAYSRNSLDFRDIFVAVVLFLGAYVWIKFREVACKGVHERKTVDKHGRITKLVYEPRFKPPRENGTVFQWIYLGQYATREEASILYQIAAFYYNEGRGGSLDLGDGHWFSIPPMREGERSLNGAEKRAWVKVQAMKVYEDFKKEKAEAALLQELLEACEDQATPSPGVDPSEANSLNSAEHHLPLLGSQAENSGMAIDVQPMPDGQGLQCASQSFGGMHEGFVTSNGHSVGFQEDSAMPISQLTPDSQSGMCMNNSNQLNLLQIVQNQQELITCMRQEAQERDTQISVLQNERRLDRQQLEESRVRISQLESQSFVQQQLQTISQGVSGFELEQSMFQQNHLCRPRGSAFW